MKVYTEPMEDGPINLANNKCEHHAPKVDSNSNEESTTEMTDGSTATSAKEIQSSTVSSVILEPMDRDCLGNMIVEPMDKVVLESNLIDKVVLDSNLIDKVVLDSTSPGNTPTPTGCASPRPMMEDEEEEEIRPVLQEAWAPLQQMQQPTALQQLAAVAERKAQEEEQEEQMEVGGGSPAGTPTPGSPSSTPPPLCLRELPSSTTILSSPVDHRDLSTSSRQLDHQDRPRRHLRLSV